MTVGINGNSEASAVVSARTVPEVPGSLYYSKLTSSSATINWTGCNDCSYIITYRDTSSSLNVARTTQRITASSYKLFLSARTTYEITMTATENYYSVNYISATSESLILKTNRDSNIVPSI
jgi:hypothetical protein